MLKRKYLIFLIGMLMALRMFPGSLAAETKTAAAPSAQTITTASTAMKSDDGKALNPIDPTKIPKHEPTKEDIARMKEWISVYNLLSTSVRISVKDTIMASAGESVGNNVWNSVYTFGENVMRASNAGSSVEKASGLKNVGSKQEDLIAALVGSYFRDIKEWRYYEGETGKYPYQPAVELWNHGFIVSLDMGGTWRMHSAQDGSIVYSIESQEVAVNKAFSCLVSQPGKVYWRAGIDSCDELIKRFKLDDGKTSYAKVEIVPDNTKEYTYLFPDKPWKLIIDEKTAPAWWTQENKDAAWKAFEEWKKIVFQFNYTATLNPFNIALSRQHEPTTGDIANLKEWALVWKSVKASKSSIGVSAATTVRDYVGPCVWNNVSASIEAAFRALHVECPGAVVCQGVEAHLGASLTPSVRDAIGDSVGDGMSAFVAGYFINIKKWKYYEGGMEGYPYRSGAELWAHGLIPSFDGKVWRLSSGEDAVVVLEISDEKLMLEK